MTRIAAAVLLFGLGCQPRLGAREPEVEDALVAFADDYVEFRRLLKRRDAPLTPAEIRSANADCRKGVRAAKRSIRRGFIAHWCDPMPAVCDEAFERKRPGSVAAREHLCGLAPRPFQDTCHRATLEAERDRRFGPGVYEAELEARCKAQLDEALRGSLPRVGRLRADPVEGVAP